MLGLFNKVSCKLTLFQIYANVAEDPSSAILT